MFVVSKLKYLLIAAVLMITSISPVAFASAELIKNNSAEAVSSTGPQSWATNKWGSSNASFSVKTDDASDGKNSLYVTVSNYQSGDAKWYHDYVDVVAGREYAFSDYYKSNVTSQVTAAVLHTDGQFSYHWLGDVAASPNAFARYEGSFVAPANAKSVSVFHLIATNGWLQTDNYSLSEKAASPEQPPTVVPAEWLNNKWGSIEAQFDVGTSVSNQEPVLKLNVTSRSSGDAKWYKAPQTVEPSTDYEVSGLYRSSVRSNITIEITTTSGAKKYYWLADLEASPNKFTSYELSYTTPADAKSMTVFHLLNTVGTLDITNQRLIKANVTNPEPPTGASFKRPLISIEFDDGWDNAYQNGFPAVEQYGFRATANVITGTYGWDEYMNTTQIKNLYDRGHGIASHTVSHPHLPQLSATKLSNELSKSKQSLQSITQSPVDVLVTPYCESSSSVLTVAKKYYTAVRNCDAASNKKASFDAYNLRSYIVLQSTTAAELQSWIDEAKATNSWAIIVYHEIKTNVDNDWAISPATLRTQLQQIKNSGVDVVTTKDALAEVRSQL